MSTNAKIGGKKIGLNTLISWGASVVIIGLMFKLLHWPGGEWMIGIGLLVEACLFFLLGINALGTDSAAVQTQQVEIAEPEDKSNQLDELLNKSINPHTIERLNRGFERFNETVESVNNVANHATAAERMVNEIEGATNEINELKKNLAELNKKYRAQIETFGK